MNRRSDAILRTTMALIAFCCAMLLGVQPMQAAQAGQRLRIGVYENSPKIGTSPAGKPEGIFVDLIEAIAAKEHWQIEYVPGTWNEGLARLAAGDAARGTASASGGPPRRRP